MLRLTSVYKKLESLSLNERFPRVPRHLGAIATEQ